MIPALDRSELARRIPELAGRPKARHVVVQFKQSLGSAQRGQLRRAGLNLLDYVGNQAFFASIPAKVVDVPALSRMPFLAGLEPIQRAWKLHPRVLAGKVPSWAATGKDRSGAEIVAVYALFHPDVPLLTEALDSVERHGAVVRDYLESINGLVIELPLDNINPLAEEDAVQWIEWPLPRMSEINDSNRAITQADIAQAAPYGLDGSGVTVLVYDGGFARASHVDFQGRLIVRDDSGLSDHATHVSGTVGGAGVANSTYKGMAPGVGLLSYGFEDDGTEIFLYSNPGDMENDFNEAINTYGADISNSSIGTNTEINYFDCAIQGDYGVTSALIDTIVRGDGSHSYFTEPFRVVWANGNERQGSRCDVEGYGDYYSTAPPAGAKNHITIGALNSNDDSMTSFTSWGPVDDGRMKPDVSAPGCQSGGDGGVTSCSSASDTSYTAKCGTSMASPTVCGLSALLLQDFRAQFPGEPDFRNSTLKALLAHNAEDRFNPGPDYQSGYGSVRIQRTVDFMRTANFLEKQVGQGDVFTTLVQVNPGDTELKVTLAWDDVPGTPNVTPALINDLDLRVFGPSAQQYYPWTLDPNAPGDPAVKTQANHVDNIEQVLVENPTPGIWRIEVYGYDVPQGPQSFSLCASPELISCSSQGIIALDALQYPCEATAGVQVIDCDLNTDNNTAETVTVTVNSTSETGGETVVLTETGAATAEFRGTIALSEEDSSGVLLVKDGDTVTAVYTDADNGSGGQSVDVTDTAHVDCAPPVISNVDTTNIEARSATVIFLTDELAKGSVRYGLDCGALTETATESGYETAHSIYLTGLQDNTEYYYAVDEVDEVGNARTDDNSGVCYTFTTPDIPDYFTEIFTESDNDLDYTMLTFTPDGSPDYYRGCTDQITSLPIDPTGGTSFSLLDDDCYLVDLGGATVSLYGTDYGSFCVGSNGYITFTDTDNDWTESPADHFDLPRISALFDDFSPNVGGDLSWKQLADRAVVTWQSVPEYNTTNSSTFQVEMHLDGTIVISYLDIAPTDGLAGLSEGNGLPEDFYESDLSSMGPCEPECSSDGDCDDGLYCNGLETCVDGRCQPGADPCPGQFCDEDTDICVECLDSSHCDDGQFCNGSETCIDGACVTDLVPCGGPGEVCDEDNDRCVPCDNDGVCEQGEDCSTCPNDCIGGQASGTCGDCFKGKCDGVCNPKKEGPDCTDCAPTYCCGDGVCEGDEDSFNCEVDCGPPPTDNIPPTAGFYYSKTDLTVDFTDESADSDGTVTEWSWNFGDTNTSTTRNPSHTYAVSATYTVSLTVTDDRGATGDISKEVTVSDGSGGFTLTATGYKVRGHQKADLEWSGGISTSVDIYRDGVMIDITENDGFYTDNIDNRGGGSYTYKVCEAGNFTCSNEATVTF
jgi:hypothetical protein